MSSAAARRALRPQAPLVASRSDDTASRTRRPRNGRRLGALRVGGQSGHCRREGSCGLATRRPAAETVPSCADAGNQAFYCRPAAAALARRRAPLRLQEERYLWSLSAPHLWLGAGGASRVGDGARWPVDGLGCADAAGAWGVLAVSLTNGAARSTQVGPARWKADPERVLPGAFEARRDPTLLAVCADAAAVTGSSRRGRHGRTVHATPVYDCVAGIAVGGCWVASAACWPC